MQIPPLTQSIGSAERSMRALLEQNIQEAKLSFPAWTALVFINASPLTFDQIAQRQISGRIVPSAADSRREIDGLIDTGLVSVDDRDVLTHTGKGSVLFAQLSGKVKDITQALYGDLPSMDLETTHRTLLEITKRANGLLSSPKP